MERVRKILVCGGRDYRNRGVVWKTLNEYPELTIVVHGDAPGADRLARDYCQRYRMHAMLSRGPVTDRPYPANWKTDGGRAGPLRNQRMIDTEHKPTQPIDLVIAFPGGSGTADMVRRAKAAGIPVREVK